MAFLKHFTDKFMKRNSNNPFQHDPPPAYTEYVPSNNKLGKGRLTNDNDRYHFLRTFDTIFLIDDSGSMDGSSWNEVRQVLQSIVPVCTERDQDGVDLLFLNHRSGERGPEGEGKAEGGYYNITDPRTVNDIFNQVCPDGATPIGSRLSDVMMPYLEQQSSSGADRDSVKPINIITITDGRATDDPESVIVQCAMMLDQLNRPRHQVGIQFFQVGRDSGARLALKELDDDLIKQGVRDMVDTCSWNKNKGRLNADMILKVVLGSVVRRLDRRPSHISKSHQE